MGAFYSSLKADTRRVEDEIEVDPLDPEGAVRAVMDRKYFDGFKWRVWWVAASGFFTTSYSIFATNVISPALNYVYPDCTNTYSLVINLTTLSGTMLGMLIFGYLADRHGRKAIYGLELSIVVVATIGMTTASSGHMGSMNVYGWIVFWRILLGFGLGAEYPLSAVISAEWSSSRSRGKMLAAVFLMQSLGQLAAYGFGLAILVGISRQMGLDPNEKDYNKASRIIDIVWRVTIGVGAIPALIALFLRRIIPETPLYLAHKGKFDAATEAVREVYDPYENLQFSGGPQAAQLERSNSVGSTETRGKRRGLLYPVTKYFSDIKQYLSVRGRWRALLGVMIAWFLLDVAYYGLGLDSPRTISTIWLSKPTTLNATPGTGMCSNPAWLADPAQPDISIYEMLKQDCIRNIVTITSGTLSGSIIILFAIDYLPRVTWMGWMFVVLAGLFAINGGTFFVAFETETHALTITLYVLAQVIFNLGPNTITFVVPAELFGTKYRATFYSYASAAGKLGAIVIQLILNFAVFGGDALAFERKFAGMLLAFCPAMLLGAFITLVWIPEVQYPRGYQPSEHEERDENASDNGFDQGDQRPTFRQRLKFVNRTLEDIDENPGEGQILGIRNNVGRLFGLRRRQRPSAGGVHDEEDDRHADPQPFMQDVEGSHNGEMQEVRLSGNHQYPSRNSGHSPRTRSPYDDQPPQQEEQDIVDDIELRQGRYSGASQQNLSPVQNHNQNQGLHQGYAHHSGYTQHPGYS